MKFETIGRHPFSEILITEPNGLRSYKNSLQKELKKRYHKMSKLFRISGKINPYRDGSAF
jgi:hypothetical protein